ncbi:MAG: BolA family transcriptional regulator, partial [Aeromonas jandaei]
MTMQQLIEAKLTAALSPSLLEVINESHMHRV